MRSQTRRILWKVLAWGGGFDHQGILTMPLDRTGSYIPSSNSYCGKDALCATAALFLYSNALLIAFSALFFVMMEITTNILQRTYFLWYDFERRHSRVFQPGGLHHRLVVTVFLRAGTSLLVPLDSFSKLLSTAPLHWSSDQAFQYQLDRIVRDDIKYSAYCGYQYDSQANIISFKLVVWALENRKSLAFGCSLFLPFHLNCFPSTPLPGEWIVTT